MLRRRHRTLRCTLRYALLGIALLGMIPLVLAGCAGNEGAQAPAEGSGQLSPEEQAALERYRAFMAYQQAIQTRVARQRALEQQTRSDQSLQMWQQTRARGTGQPAPQQRPIRRRPPNPRDLQAWRVAQARAAGADAPPDTLAQQQQQQQQDQEALQAWQEVQSRARLP